MRYLWSMDETIRAMPLNALRAFASICEHGGVRAAAAELGIAHSAVSRHLAQLEQWLGVALSGAPGGRRGFHLTAQGEALGKAALSGLREIAHAAAALRERRSAGSVALATTPSFAARWLLPRLPALERDLPWLEVSVVVDQRAVDLEASGADLAIRMGKGPWPDLRCESLMDDALYPVMSAALWKKSGRPSRPAHLSRLRLLHDRDPHAAWELWRAAHGPSSLDVRRGPRLASSDLLLRAAVLGQGVALARHRLAADDVASGALVRPMGELQVGIGPAYWLLMPEGFAPRPATEALAGWLKKQVVGAAP
jgi:LysR family glycine cleavage system transcriptional activator